MWDFRDFFLRFCFVSHSVQFRCQTFLGKSRSFRSVLKGEQSRFVPLFSLVYSRLSFPASQMRVQGQSLKYQV